MPWTVVIDADLCELSGFCTELAPEVFALGDDHARVRQETPPDTARAAVAEAERRCPKQAIRILEPS